MAVNKSLGRGLGALLSDDNFDTLEKQTSETAQVELPIENIIRNENQPRKTFDEAAMDELTNSVRAHGVITPIIVVKHGQKYMIIAGERRWRAAKRAGLRTIPAIVRDYTEVQIKEISLIENIQREDLNPIETAHAIKQLMDDCNYTQEQVAERIGKSRPAVSHHLGLLTLNWIVQDMIVEGRLSLGHARVLIPIENHSLQQELALAGADGKMSAREFETYVKMAREINALPPVIKSGLTVKDNSGKTIKSSANMSLELKALTENLQRFFATKVSIIGNDTKGRIYIDYYNRDDLDRIAELLESQK